MDAILFFLYILRRFLFRSQPPVDPETLTFCYVTDMSAAAGIDVGEPVVVIRPPRSEPRPAVSFRPIPPPEPPVVPAAAEPVDVLRILPESLGVARFFFLELWNRCGGRPGEIASTSIAEMIAWNPEWTESRIRKALQKLASAKYGYIAVENLSGRGRKRILVNRPTRIVHEMPLFDYAADRGDHGGQIGGDGRENRRTGETVSPPNPQSVVLQSVGDLLPDENELHRRRLERLDQLENRKNVEKSPHLKEDDSLSIIYNHLTSESSDHLSFDRRANVSMLPRQPPSKGSKIAPHGPPQRAGPKSRKGPAPASVGILEAVTTFLGRPRKNSPGMIYRREEIIKFVLEHPQNDTQVKFRDLIAQRAACCVVDLECDAEWKSFLKHVGKAKSFGRYLSGFVRCCLDKRDMDMQALDKIKREVVLGWKDG